MKKLIRILCLTACTLLLFVTCRPEEPEIFERPLFYHSYTEAGSSTDSYIQVCDSIIYFDHIYGGYGFYRGSDNRNVFYFALTNPLTYVSYENQHQKYFRIDIKTEMLSPEVFFQKGTWKIDSMYINSNLPGLTGGNGLPPIWGHQPAQCVFTWDYIACENKTFKGKGSFEIKDTIYITYPETVYYPPQKIEFEFK